MIIYQASTNLSSLLQKYICKITTRVRWRTKPFNMMKLRQTFFVSFHYFIHSAQAQMLEEMLKSVSTYEHVLRDSKTENKDYNKYQYIISSIAATRCFINDTSKYNFITRLSALCIHTHRLDGRCSRNALVVWIRDPALTI